MRIVLDTNIWISGLLLPDSLAGKLLIAWRKNQLNIVLSNYILQEIEKVLHYPKISKRLKWDNEKINQYLALLSFFCEIVDISAINVEVKSDPHDSGILATLLASKADYLITGDSDLLNLADKYSIMTLANFYRNKITT